MLILGFCEFLRNIKRNLLVIIQMVAVYIIVIFTVSAFEEQYRLMDGVSDVFDETGMIMYARKVGSEEFIEESQLKELLVKVEKIEHSLNYGVLYEVSQHQQENIKICASNPKNISYRPELIDGEWCDDAKHEEGVINAVVSNNIIFDYTIGEKVEIDGHTFKITGVVDEKEMIYGATNRFRYTEASYLSYYIPINEISGGENGLIIASYGDLQKCQLHPYNYSALWGLLVTVDFEDDITAEEIEYNLRQMVSRYEYTEGSEIKLTEEMYDYSWRLIMLKIMPMLMLLAVIVVVLVVSLVISGTINVLYERKNYGIYFICGNNWKNTFKFSLVNWTIMAITSLILAVCACVFIHKEALFDGLILSFTSMHVLAILGITVAMLVITVFIPFIKLRRIQPVSILKENYK